MIGSIILHYKILEKIGEGGMGTVYKARDTKLDRFVALKFLPDQLTKSDNEKARFLQEAKAVAALNHPNVCVIHEIQDHCEPPFIVMEYVEGKTLRDLNFTKPQSLNKVIEYAIQIAAALQEAHSMGIVHRDIKSENIMINSKDQIKVMDFGLAKLRGSARLTQTSTTLGTLAYMSPEQLQNKQVDARSDIFSFGIVLYEMLTGQLPFSGDYDAAVMYSILNEPAQPIQKYHPDAPSSLIHILDRMLEKNPEDRYQSMSEIQSELRRLNKQITGSIKAPEIEKPAVTNKKYPISFKRRTTVMSITVLLLLAVVSILLIRYFTKENILPFQHISLTKLTTHGQAEVAAISPDGKYAVHVMKEADGESIWLRHLVTNSNTRLLPPVQDQLGGLSFSPDGNYIYFDRREGGENYNLYYIPVLGGVPRVLLDNVSSGITFSPDGKQIAFFRINFLEGKSALMTANSDGSNVQELTALKFPKLFSPVGLPAWSPDGKVIICGEINFKDNITRLVEFKVKDGQEKVLSDQQWRLIGPIVWLNSGEGLFMIATGKSGGHNPQIWYISYPEGELRRITNDLNNYVSLSLSKINDAILTVQQESRSNIWIVSGADVSKSKQITDSRNEGSLGITWTPDGRIVYASQDNGLGIMEADGSNQHLLMLNKKNAMLPAVSADGHYIAFAATGGGPILYIWKMDIDGGNLKQLTTHGESFPQFTPDGKWIIYTAFSSGIVALWKIPATGGTPQQITNEPAAGGAISHNGNLIACFYQGTDSTKKWMLAILRSSGGKPIKIFKLPVGFSMDVQLRWTPDDKAITYIVDFNGISNIWSQPLDGSPPKKVTGFNGKQINAYDFSRNGTLACARGNAESDVVLIKDLR